MRTSGRISDIGCGNRRLRDVVACRAAELARDAEATLIIAGAYFPQDTKSLAQERDVLGPDVTYQLVGSAPADETVRWARDRAIAAGATHVKTAVEQGKPAATLHQVVEDHAADLLAVADRGLNTPAGRILGSVPLDVTRHTPVDVLIVHST